VFDNANSTLRDKELDPEHNITFAASGFTVTAQALTDPSSIDNNMPTQIAGSAFNLHLTAYGTSANDPQCGIIETYTADKELIQLNSSEGMKLKQQELNQMVKVLRALPVAQFQTIMTELKTVENQSSVNQVIEGRSQVTRHAHTVKILR
jgi:hypothetical protein